MEEVNIQIATRLDSPELPGGHSLHKVIDSALKGRPAFHNPDRTRIFWSAEHFRLDKVSLFQGASEEERRMILERCSQNVLAEAYYVEKCGMYFASKMSLLAETTEERVLYSLFGADEAAHYNWIKQFACTDVVNEHLANPFVRMLDELLRREDPATLVYLVQVILEGWGISHYHSLMSDCLDDDLRRVFETILKDEARHHGSGLVLFSERQSSAPQVGTITSNLARFFRLVQVGPQAVVSAIERVKGQLSREQRERTFNELDCQADTAKKIATLCALIKAADGADEILASLERGGFLRPFTATECANIV